MDSVIDTFAFGVSITLLKYLYMSMLESVMCVNRDG